MQSRRSRIKELELDNTFLKASIRELKRKVGYLNSEIESKDIMIAHLNTRAHNDIANYFKLGDLSVEIAELKKENEKLKNTKWHKEYQKVVVKLEKIVNKNKPF